MKRTITCLIIAALVLIVTESQAGKPAKAISLSNGFPSGFHFNLIILGKKNGFVCPSAGEYYPINPITLEPMTNNVVFIPQFTTKPVDIFLLSGKKGFVEFNVTDWCAGISGSDDSAMVEIPTDPSGYDVYVRVNATTHENSSIQFTPSLAETVDLNDGNGLIYVGALNSDGFVTTGEPQTFKKWEDGDTSKGSRRTNASNITDMFLWTGYVKQVYYAASIPFDIVPGWYCWQDMGTIQGEYDASDVLTYVSPIGDLEDPTPDSISPCDLQSLYDALCVDGKLVYISDLCCWTDNDNGIIEEGEVDCAGEYDCSSGVEIISFTIPYCNEWIFNINDIVKYLWSVDNLGVKNTQVRLYPRSLNLE